MPKSQDQTKNALAPADLNSAAFIGDHKCNEYASTRHALLTQSLSEHSIAAKLNGRYATQEAIVANCLAGVKEAIANLPIDSAEYRMNAGILYVCRLDIKSLFEGKKPVGVPSELDVVIKMYSPRRARVVREHLTSGPTNLSSFESAQFLELVAPMEFCIESAAFTNTATALLASVQRFGAAIKDLKGVNPRPNSVKSDAYMEPAKRLQAMSKAFGKKLLDIGSFKPGPINSWEEVTQVLEGIQKFNKQAGEFLEKIETELEISSKEVRQIINEDAAAHRGKFVSAAREALVAAQEKHQKCFAQQLGYFLNSNEGHILRYASFYFDSYNLRGDKSFEATADDYEISALESLELLDDTGRTEASLILSSLRERGFISTEVAELVAPRLASELLEASSDKSSPAPLAEPTPEPKIEPSNIELWRLKLSVLEELGVQEEDRHILVDTISVDKLDSITARLALVGLEGEKQSYFAFLFRDDSEIFSKSTQAIEKLIDSLSVDLASVEADGIPGESFETLSELQAFLSVYNPAEPEVPPIEASPQAPNQQTPLSQLQVLLSAANISGLDPHLAAVVLLNGFYFHGSVHFGNSVITEDSVCDNVLRVVGTANYDPKSTKKQIKILSRTGAINDSAGVFSLNIKKSSIQGEVFQTAVDFVMRHYAERRTGTSSTNTEQPNE